MDDTYDKNAAKAMAYLRSQASISGVAALNFEDGEMFMFTREMVMNLIDQMDKKGSDDVVVFIKREGGKSKELLDN